MARSCRSPRRIARPRLPLRATGSGVRCHPGAAAEAMAPRGHDSTPEPPHKRNCGKEKTISFRYTLGQPPRNGRVEGGARFVRSDALCAFVCRAGLPPHLSPMRVLLLFPERNISGIKPPGNDHQESSPVTCPPTSSRACGLPLLAQEAEQHVVLPAAVDAEIFPRVAFLAEAALHQQSAARRRCAARHAASTPMEPRALEGEGESAAAPRSCSPGARDARPSSSRGSPVSATPRRTLVRPMPPSSVSSLETEQQEAVALVAAPVGGIAREPAAERRRGSARRRDQVGSHGREEGARFAAQLGPGAPIAPLGRAQHTRWPVEAEGAAVRREEARRRDSSSGTTRPHAPSVRRAGRRPRSARPGPSAAASAARRDEAPRHALDRRRRRRVDVCDEFAAGRAAGRTPACASPAARSAPRCSRATSRARP